MEEFHGGAAGDSGSVATGTTAGEHSEELIRRVAAGSLLPYFFKLSNNGIS